MEDDDDFMNFAEEQVGSRLERIRPTLLEIEQQAYDRKERNSRNKDRIQDRMVDMTTLALDALQMGLQSEDEGIRMKALAMWMDRNTHRQGVKKEEEIIEVEDVGKKLSLEEIENVLRKKGMIDDAGGE